VVYGLAQTLCSQPGLDDNARELSQTLAQQAQRVSSMVNKLLDMARLRSGSVQLNQQWQPVDEVVGVALQAMQVPLASHRVVLDLPPGLPLLHLDATLMERLLCNLLENAAKYTPAGSEIRISAHLEKDALRLTVADNGPGLPEGREEQLFAKFTRGESESATPGVGLGLAICRAIVEAHGGRIWAERSGLGVGPGLGGAAFQISLPLGEPPALPELDEMEALDHD